MLYTIRSLGTSIFWFEVFQLVARMEVLGKKEACDDKGRTTVVDVTAWTLLGLCLDHLYKVWARDGAPAVQQCEVFLKRQVKVCRVVAKGEQRFPSPGVARWFSLSDGSFALAVKLLDDARGRVAALRWRVFDGDVDLKTNSGQHKGAVDGLADRDGVRDQVGLIELKVRRLKEERAMQADMANLCSDLNDKWSRYRVPRLKTNWTHGVLICFWQASVCNQCAERDTCRAIEWVRGSPPQRVQLQPAPIILPVQPQPKPKAQPKLPAVPARMIARPQVQSASAKFASLLSKLRAEDHIQRVGGGSNEEWCFLPAFLVKVGVSAGQVSQAKRNFLDSGAWKLGEGRGRKLRQPTDWDYVKRARGKGGGRGRGVLHVKTKVLKEVFSKYYSSRQLQL